MTRILVLTQTLGLPGCGTVISQTYGTSTEERTTREIVDDTAIVARIKKAYLEESRENLLRRRPARSLTTRGRWMAWWPSDPSCRSRPSNSGIRRLDAAPPSSNQTPSGRIQII